MQGILKLIAGAGLAVFGLVGIVLSAIGIKDYVDLRQVLKTAEETQGVVVSVGRRVVETGSGTSRSTSVVDYAEIEFPAGDEGIYVFEHTYGLLEGSFEKGDGVDVYYLPEDPTEAIVNSFSSLYLLHLIFVLAGLLFIGAGVLVYRVISPGRERKDFRFPNRGGAREE